MLLRPETDAVSLFDDEPDATTFVRHGGLTLAVRFLTVGLLEHDGGRPFTEVRELALGTAGGIGYSLAASCRLD